MNSIVILLSGILLVGILFVVFYEYLYKGRTVESTTLISGNLAIDENFQRTINLAKLIGEARQSIVIPGYGNGLTFKWSMYLEDPVGERFWHSSYSKDKPIITIGDSPHIYYNPKYNVLKITVKYNETPFYAHYPIIELKDIPLRRWNDFVVCIDGAHVKIWINGEYRISKQLANEPVISTADIEMGQVGNNINGQIRDFELYFRPFSTAEIKKRLLPAQSKGWFW